MGSRAVLFKIFEGEQLEQRPEPLLAVVVFGSYFLVFIRVIGLQHLNTIHVYIYIHIYIYTHA